MFPDGHQGYASATESFGGTELGKVPVPPLVLIAADSQFDPTEISREDFEHVWVCRLDDVN